MTLPTPVVVVDDATRDRARTATWDALHRTGSRRRHRAHRVVPLLSLVAACLGLALVTVGITGSQDARPAPPASGPAVVDPATGAVLDRIALAAQRATPSAPTPDDFVYVRSHVISNEGGFGEPPHLGSPHVREAWYSQSPTDDQHDVLHEDGQDWPIQYAGGAPAGPGRPTYAWLATLPTDPQRMLDRLRELCAVMRGDGSDRAVFSWIGDLSGETMMPPRTAAALWRAARLIPGVRAVPDATDALGRRGLGITLDSDEAARDVWLFDPTTYRFIGSRQYLEVSSGQGEFLFGATAIEERAVVDGRKRLPGDRRTSPS